MPNCGSKTTQKETLSSAYFGATGCLSLGSEWEQKSARIASSTQETCDLLFSSALGSGDQNKLPGTYKEFNKWNWKKYQIIFLAYELLWGTKLGLSPSHIVSQLLGASLKAPLTFFLLRQAWNRLSAWQVPSTLYKRISYLFIQF